MTPEEALWRRLELSESLLDACMDYLGGRESGDSTLLHRQLVQAAIADALITHLEVRAVLTGGLPARLADHLDFSLTDTAAGLLRLLGASGFVADGPGRIALESELIAETTGTADVLPR